MVKEDCSDSFTLAVGLMIILIYSFVMLAVIGWFCNGSKTSTNDCQGIVSEVRQAEDTSKDGIIGKDYVPVIVNENEYILDNTEQEVVSDFISKMKHNN